VSSRHGPTAPGWPGALLLATALAVATACGAGASGSDSAEAASGGTGRSAAGISGEVVVFAASSLTGTFGRLGREFESRHPGVDVTFSFGGSSSLGPQITSGAPADVFAAASPQTMADVVAADANAAPPVLFARNRLQIAVPADNPGDVQGLDDFARPELALAVCAPQVPCGSAAQRAFGLGGVQDRPDTFEQEVTAVLTKVELGEVDAGMVYRTDVLSAGGRVQGIDFPAATRAVNDYQIAELAESPNPTAGRAWVRFVLSSHGQEVLGDAGFLRP
jgi:molybdate transport system substrate-binding protein